MNAAQVHLALNHLPLFALLFGLACLGIGLIKRKGDLAKTGLLTFLFAGLSAIPVYLSGEPAEEVVEEFSGISKSVIEEHEDAALGAFIVVEALGVLALASLFMPARWARITTSLVVVISLLSLALMMRAANLGGHIRHPEIEGKTISTQGGESGEGD
jgi:hypothetical protein